ncbi:MAG: stringent starvation protein SspA [Gammaproteobacteria bacterium]
MAVVAKRTVMTLYSDPNNMYSHQVRIVLAEKGVNFEVVNAADPDNMEKLRAVNPYNSVPTLIDRELVLYQAQIIMEYLDERFPHPPLLPVYPVLRAQSRKMLYRIDRDWYSLAELILRNDDDQVDVARKQLTQSLVNLAPVFADKAYFFSDDFTLVDCCIAPLLWRLPQMGIELPAEADPVLDYADNMFQRKSFQESLTDVERELREAA